MIIRDNDYKSDRISLLCDKIQTEAFIRYNIYNDNYNLLQQAIYCVSTTTSYYNKDDVRDFLWSELKYHCNSDDNDSNRHINSFKRGFNELFDACWKNEFQPDNSVKSPQKLSRIVYANRTLSNKLVNNNYALVVFILLFFALQYIVTNSFVYLEFVDMRFKEICTTLIIFWMMFIHLACYQKRGSVYYELPIYGIVIMFIIALLDLFDMSEKLYRDLLSEREVIELARRNVIMGLLYLLWYPMIYFNSQRLHDWYD